MWSDQVRARLRQRHQRPRLNEHLFRHGRDVNDLLVISLGRGIGLGMVLDGRSRSGAVGGAGEFGHITIDPNGPMCACGKHGCLEALVGISRGADDGNRTRIISLEVARS